MTLFRRKLRFTKIRQVLFILLIASHLNGQGDTLDLYFGIGKSTLKAHHLTAMDSFFSKAIKEELRIKASADFIGSIRSNQRLSDRRLQVVSDYVSANYGSKIFKIISSSQGEFIVNENQYDANLGIPAHRTVRLLLSGERPVDLSILTTVKEGTVVRLKNMNFLPGRHRLLKY